MTYNHKNIIAGAPTTTLVKSGEGTLASIIINEAAADAIITIYDGIDATGTLIGTITNPATLLANSFVLAYHVAFKTGLTIVTTTAQDITISYN